MKILLMAHREVGKEIAQWLFRNYINDLALVVTISDNEIYTIAKKAKIPTLVFDSNEQLASTIANVNIDYGILAWWPKLIKKPLLNLPKNGFINTHPSYLPYNRGKHYNFWTLVEQSPFGVSLHFITEGIDNGDIIAQKLIPYDWEDNGASLYVKAQKEMVKLFKKTYPMIRESIIQSQKQDLSQGSFHTSNELEQASIIDLDKNYQARDLLNLLRARTFPGYPSCSFVDSGKTYEVQIQIKRKINESK